jgi:sporulation protein YlmC with PRC-barrel domain
VLLLSRITGQVVRGPDGQAIGRLADLTADLVEESGPHLVDRVVVARRRGRQLVIPWEQVATLEHGRLVLACAAPDAEDYAVDDLTAALGEREILLVRDVLDTQVVDVVGQRLARVADVVLTRTPEGRLELIGVEVGFAGVLRRLGLPALEKSGADIVVWTDLHLASERGHSVQLATPRSAVHRLDARELAGLLSRLDTEAAAEILAVKGPGIAADVVRAAHPAVGERVLRAMPEQEAARIVAAMPAEHAGRWRDVLQHAPALLGRRFLRFRVWPRRQHTVGPS